MPSSGAGAGAGGGDCGGAGDCGVLVVVMVVVLVLEMVVVLLLLQFKGIHRLNMHISRQKSKDHLLQVLCLVTDIISSMQETHNKMHTT